MRRKLAFLVCFWMVGLVHSESVFADVPLPANIKSGVQCYESLNYKCAVSRLSRAWSDHQADRVPLTRAHQLLLQERLAFAYASLGNGADAEKAFERCLALREDYSLDRAVISPKIYRHYASALERHILSSLGDLLPPSFEPKAVTPSYASRGLLALEGGANSRVLSRNGPHEVNAELGAMMLFGDDADAFYPGFGVGLQYVYAVSDTLAVEAVAHLYSHVYAGDDLKAGHSGNLYNLDLGAGVRTGVRLGNRVLFVVGLRAGLAMLGITALTDSVGGFVSAPVGVDITVVPGFLMGLSVAPTVLMGQNAADELAVSIGVPILTRFRVAF